MACNYSAMLVTLHVGLFASAAIEQPTLNWYGMVAYINGLISDSKEVLKLTITVTS